MATIRHTEVSADVNCAFFPKKSLFAVSDSQASPY